MVSKPCHISERGANSLVEETETHIFVGFLLLFFLCFLLSLLSWSSTTSGSGGATSSSSTARTTSWDECELSRAFGDQL